jgi:agmatine deiminase
VITDAQTNLLCFADTLPVQFPVFYSELKRVLDEVNVKFQLLPNTKDIWAVDFMPVQVTTDKFVQFVYRPDYLQSKRWIETISDGGKIAGSLGIQTQVSKIILDGGNITNTTNKVILCDKILKENRSQTKDELLSELKRNLEVEELFLVSQQPGDFIGHADGMIRFVDDDTILVNDYSKEKPSFRKVFDAAILKTKLNSITMPYNPYQNRTNTHANGIYVNYLQMERLIVFPVYGLREDDQAVRVMETSFPGYTIKTIDCNEIANHGGVLNCISWNVKL